MLCQCGGHLKQINSDVATLDDGWVEVMVFYICQSCQNHYMSEGKSKINDPELIEEIDAKI